jgi:nitrogenase molybdenum-iron protein alpha chain
MHDFLDELPITDESPIDLTKSTCPTREERLSVAVNAYYGKMSDLVKDTREHNVVQPERCFEQSGNCLLALNAQRLISIRDSVLLFHSPIGCAAGQHSSHELFQHIPLEQGRPADLGFFHAVCTNLTEKDVVYGGIDKLIAALKESDRRYSPKAIFLVTSCAAGIIGDDIEGAVNAAQPHVRAKIVPCHTEGFRSRVTQTGYDAFWHGVLKYLVKKDLPRQKDLVNVTNMFSYTWMDKIELQRLLNKIGLRVNFVPEFARVEDLEIMGSAAVTAPVCPTFADYLMRGLKEHFDVPYFKEPIPFGVKKTDGWLRKVAEFTGKEKEVEELIKEEHAKYMPQVDAIRAELEVTRKRFVAAGLKKENEKLTAIGSVGQGRVIGHAAFLEEIGMSVIGACTIDYDSLIADAFDALVKEVGDFVVLVSTFQAADYSSLFSRLKPDLTLQAPFKGSVIKSAKAMGTIHYLRGDNHPSRTQAGYAGAVAYGNMIVRTFKNDALTKLIGRLGDEPYKAWWYDADPMYFVKDRDKIFKSPDLVKIDGAPVHALDHEHDREHAHAHNGHGHDHGHSQDREHGHSHNGHAHDHGHTHEHGDGDGHTHVHDHVPAAAGAKENA